MSIHIQCPHCDSVYSVIERAVGRRVRCPTCDELVEVSPNRLSPMADAAYEQEEAERVASGEAVETESLVPIDDADEARGFAGDAAAEWSEPEPPPFIASPEGPLASSESTFAGGPRGAAPVVFHRERKGQEPEMDMTPMVDVTFLLLIFFMVTASFTMQKSLNIPKPESNEASPQPQTIQDFNENPDYVVVRVDANNTFYVASTAFDEEIEAPSEQELLVKLRQAREGDDQGNVPSKMLVMANGGATHERVVVAIDAGNDVGMEEVQLVTVEDDE